MKKIALIVFGICLALCSIGYVFYHFTIVRQRQIYANEIMSRLGGEGEIKKYCIKQRTGPIEMENGEKLPRYLSGWEITFNDKMCDCVVEKTYKAISTPKIAASLENVLWNETMVEFIKSMFLLQFAVCEIEVQEMLNKKYKPIDIEN